MPYSLYISLDMGPLTKTGVMIQLADRSYVYPEGVLEDVLVQVNELVFPADIYVLKMGSEECSSSSSILLGRPFLRTARTKIDCHEGHLSMEFDGKVITFNLFDAMRYPLDDQSIMTEDFVDVCSMSLLDFVQEDPLLTALTQGMDYDNLDFEEEIYNEEIQSILASLAALPSKLHLANVSYMDLPIPSTKLLPSIIEAPSIELKPLPAHLKYAFLGENETLPVIISNNLTSNQELQLLQVLKARKEAIGWTVADIKGISPSICMHRILLEDDAKPLGNLNAA